MGKMLYLYNIFMGSKHLDRIHTIKNKLAVLKIKIELTKRDIREQGGGFDANISKIESNIKQITDEINKLEEDLQSS